MKCLGPWVLTCKDNWSPFVHGRRKLMLFSVGQKLWSVPKWTFEASEFVCCQDLISFFSPSTNISKHRITWLHCLCRRWMIKHDSLPCTGKWRKKNIWAVVRHKKFVLQSRSMRKKFVPTSGVKRAMSPQQLLFRMNRKPEESEFLIQYCTGLIDSKQFNRCRFLVQQQCQHTLDCLLTILKCVFDRADWCSTTRASIHRNSSIDADSSCNNNASTTTLSIAC
jgi:hypothetical protein